MTLANLIARVQTALQWRGRTRSRTPCVPHQRKFFPTNKPVTLVVPAGTSNIEHPSLEVGSTPSVAITTNQDPPVRLVSRFSDDSSVLSNAITAILIPDPVSPVVSQPESSPSDRAWSLSNTVIGSNDPFAAVIKLKDSRSLPFTLMEHLGEGASACVLRARTHTSGKRFAVKIINIRKMAARCAAFKQNISNDGSFSDVNQILQEQRMGIHVTQFNSPLVVPLLASGRFGSSMLFAMPLYAGSLSDFFRGHFTLSSESLQIWSAELISGLIFLYVLCRVMHLDIKPENILVSSTGHLAYADFGLSQMADSSPIFENLPPEEWPLCEICGTDVYSAPEFGMWHSATRDRILSPPDIFLLMRFSAMKADVFSLGCVLYELFMGTRFLCADAPNLPPALLMLPHEIPHQLGITSRYHSKLEDLIAPYKSEPLPEGCIAELLHRMLVFQNSERISLFEIQCHEFFSGIDWDAISKHEIPIQENVDFSGLRGGREYVVNAPHKNPNMSESAMFAEYSQVSPQFLKEEYEDYCASLDPFAYLCPNEVAIRFGMADAIF